jgi:hypothetical protein
MTWTAVLEYFRSKAAITGSKSRVPLVAAIGVGPADGRPVLGQDAEFLVGSAQVGLAVIRVDLDLIDRGATSGLRHQQLQSRRSEVRHADRTHASINQKTLRGLVGLVRLVEFLSKRLTKQSQVASFLRLASKARRALSKP